LPSVGKSPRDVIEVVRVENIKVRAAGIRSV
jgi:hypothetical protein